MQPGMAPVSTWQGFTVRKPSQTRYSACIVVVRMLAYNAWPELSARHCIPVVPTRFHWDHPLAAACDVHHGAVLPLCMPLLCLLAMYQHPLTSLC
jgi:hypothetical protein